MSFGAEVVVVGAGVVGLAVARALARRGSEVVILEAEPAIGTGISSRNSEVIHAGLYYPTGSLKARLCVAGRRMLYDYCAERGIPHRRCGKLVVAAEEAQRPALEALHARAVANGVEGLRLLDAVEARGLEPELHCVAALLSPVTGILDSHQLMLSLLGEAEAAGAVLALGSPVVGGRLLEDGILLEVGGAEPTTLTCRILVNAAGLGAVRLAAALAGFPAERLPAFRLAKGNYFSLAGRCPFQRLIYPLPEPGGLGVHLTLDLGGQARFGPDVEWVAGQNYDVDPARAPRFAESIRRWWPGLPAESLRPAYAGIRPKLHGPDEPAADFVIQGPEAHGVPGLINLFGIESPGLTASLAIADAVANRLAAA